jgi:hypothetical protein
MSIGEQVVRLDIACSNVGQDDTDSPGEFTMLIGLENMERLESYLAYEVQARELFLKQFAGQMHDWSHIELMFDGFKPTCLVDSVPDEDSDEDEDFDPEAPDMRIDCRGIRLLEDAVVLVANVRNGSTQIISEQIPHDKLRDKFAELRALIMSDSTVGMVGDAVTGEGAEFAPAGKSATGMSL